MTGCCSQSVSGPIPCEILAPRGFAVEAVTGDPAAAAGGPTAAAGGPTAAADF